MEVPVIVQIDLLFMVIIIDLMMYLCLLIALIISFR